MNLIIKILISVFWLRIAFAAIQDGNDTFHTACKCIMIFGTLYLLHNAYFSKDSTADYVLIHKDRLQNPDKGFNGRDE